MCMHAPARRAHHQCIGCSIACSSSAICKFSTSDKLSDMQGLFNFRPAVRPVPLEAHIQGYPGKFYCPRMATMNKPAYAALTTHSPNKPALIFVSSRRQTRLTALDLVAYAAADCKPAQWLHMHEAELAEALATVKDTNLKHTLQFGIGLHHAGLPDKDRQLVEALFCEQKIQVLVATSTLAWGVNTPAHLVIIKGTEYFDAPTKRCAEPPCSFVHDNQRHVVLIMLPSRYSDSAMSVQWQPCSCLEAMNLLQTCQNGVCADMWTILSQMCSR